MSTRPASAISRRDATDRVLRLLHIVITVRRHEMAGDPIETARLLKACAPHSSRTSTYRDIDLLLRRGLIVHEDRGVYTLGSEWRRELGK